MVIPPVPATRFEEALFAELDPDRVYSFLFRDLGEQSIRAFIAGLESLQKRHPDHRFPAIFVVNASASLYDVSALHRMIAAILRGEGMEERVVNQVVVRVLALVLGDERERADREDVNGS